MFRRLEYSFGMWTCHLGSKFKRMVNPFNNAEMKAYSDEGLTQTERKAADSLLLYYGAKLDDEGDFFHLEFADGVEIFLGIGILTDDTRRVISAEVNVVGPHLSDEAVVFLYNLAGVANMAFTPLVAGLGPEAVTTEPVDDVIKKRWPDVVVILTPAELRGWVETYARPRGVT